MSFIPKAKIVLDKFWSWFSHATVIAAGAVAGDFASVFLDALGRRSAPSSSKWLFIEAGAISLWILWHIYSIVLSHVLDKDWRKVRAVDALTWTPFLLLWLYSHNHMIREIFGGVYYGSAYIALIIIFAFALKVIHAAGLIGGARWALAAFVSIIAGMIITAAKRGCGADLFTWLDVDTFVFLQIASAGVFSIFALASGLASKSARSILAGAIAVVVILAAWLGFAPRQPADSTTGFAEIEKLAPAGQMGLFGAGGPVKRVRTLIGGELRDAILFPRDGAVSEKIVVPPTSALTFGVGVADLEKRSADSAVVFRLEVDLNGEKREIWSRRLNPAESPDDCGWFDASVDLSPYSGSEATLVFSVRGEFGVISKPRLIQRNGNSGKLPNIVVVLLDTLRADHVGAYGYRRNTTPFIDELARSGTVFRNAMSTAAWTEPAVFSILTGMLPGQADVDMFASVKIPEAAETLAESLSRRGYETGAITGNYYITESLKFDQGFGTFNEKCLPNFHWRSAECVTDESLKWADSQGDAPFFLYAHYVDPHSRYNAPPPYHDMFSYGYTGEDPRIGRGETMEFELLYERSGKKIVLPEEDRRYLIDLYDGEIAYADAQIKRLLDGLKERGLLKNTVVVVLSDHGEEFTEHGILGHRLNLHGTLVGVPLIMWGEGLIPAGKTINDAVSVADVTPTLLDFAGTTPSGYAWGRSLAPLIRGENLPRRVCFAQRKQLFFREYAVFDGRYKMIAERDGTVNPRFYDLAGDPLEFHAVSPDESMRRKAPSDALEIIEWIKKRKIEWEGPGRILDDAESRKRIKAMGYLAP